MTSTLTTFAKQQLKQERTMTSTQIIFLLVMCCRLGAAQLFSANCADTSYGKSCRLRIQPLEMKTLDNKVLFGANNSLEVYALDLQYSESISFIATDETRQDCINLGVN